jgi:hypothetical protein
MFFLLFLLDDLMIEGSEAGTRSGSARYHVPTGSGSGRPKNIRIGSGFPNTAVSTL